MSANEDLRAAIYSGAEVSEIQQCLDAGADPNLRMHNGWTPLLEAETFEVARLLLERGADASAEDDFGRGVFHSLAHTQTPHELAHLFRCTKARLEGRDCDGSTPLLHALSSAQGHAAAPLALLSIGADAFALDAQGNNALHCWATGRARIEVGERLLALGVDPCACNRLGQTVGDMLDDQQHEGREFIRAFIDREELSHATVETCLPSRVRRI